MKDSSNIIKYIQNAIKFTCVDIFYFIKTIYSILYNCFTSKSFTQRLKDFYYYISFKYKKSFISFITLGFIYGDNKSDKWLSKNFLRNIFRELLLLMILIDFGFQNGIVPTGSMIKTLQVGDIIFTKKFAYGYNNSSFFFTRAVSNLFGIKLINGIWFKKPIKRGDIINFEHQTGQVYCKRVIAIENDVVKMQNGIWYVNDIPFTQERCGIYEYYDGYNKKKAFHFIQNTDGVKHSILKDKEEGGEHSISFDEIIIPEGHVWCIGDNMDCSYDSRFFGPVSEDKIMGKVCFILCKIGLPSLDVDDSTSNFAIFMLINKVLKADWEFFKYVFQHSDSSRAFSIPK